jgi:hypothetical protein
MPRIRTPWDRDHEVDRDGGPDVVPPMADPAENYADPAPPAPPSGDRPASEFRFEARIGKDGAITIPASLIAPALGAVLGWWKDQSPGVSSGVEPTVDHLASLPQDAIVDQRCARIPKDAYLKLARARAFPSRRVGRRVLARWGDVLAAVSGLIEPSTEEGPDPEEAMRLRWGLARRR